MISNGEKQYYLAIKKSSALLRGIKSKTNGEYYYLNCLRFFARKSKRESHKKICENKDF